MATSIGIDFGTSNVSAWAWLEDGPHCLTAEPTLPAWVYLGDREVLVGAAARDRASTEPQRCVQGIKRLLGRKFHGPDVAWLRELSPLALVPADNGDAWLRIGREDLSPEQIAGELLGHLRAQAGRRLNEEITRTTIALPACADLRLRAAIVAAAHIAGFDEVSLVGKPYAALAAMPPPPAGAPSAVLCLGDGNFDVLIVEREQDDIRARAVAGDSVLGLDDVDRRIVQAWLREASAQQLLASPHAITQLRGLARAQRSALEAGEHPPPIRLEGPPRFEHPGFDREQLERLAIPELERMAGPCTWALEDAGVGTADLGALVVVGSGAGSRLVRESLAFLFQREPQLHPEPDLAARGAARLAAGVVAPVAPVAPHSLGLRVQEGRMSTLIDRNTVLPTRRRKVFAPARAGQSLMMLEVYQGEEEMVTDNVYLGRFVLGDRGPIEPTTVYFALDRDGMLSIEAESDGTTSSLPLQASGGMDAEEIERLAEARRAASASAPPKGKRRTVGRQLERTVCGALSTSVPPPRGRPALLPDEPATGSDGKRSVPPLPKQDPDRTIPQTSPPDDSPFIRAHEDSLVGSVLGGRYAVETLIAEGGMGRVYLAKHTVLGRPFAIKVLHAELANNEEMNARFVLEAQAASSVRNQHVIDISDFGRLEDGTGYFVMEYLEGETLSEVIESAGPLPPDVIIDVGIQLARGLGAAHDLGIVHRDLKPGNVTLVPRERSSPLCKILDFGIAKSFTTDSAQNGERLTLAGVVLGTPLYMAPEQILAEPVDARADLYALGAVLYEMATGGPPFEADTIPALLAQHRQSPPTPIRARPRTRTFPRELERIILTCLAKAPDDRFPNASALEDALASLA